MLIVVIDLQSEFNYIHISLSDSEVIDYIIISLFCSSQSDLEANLFKVCYFHAYKVPLGICIPFFYSLFCQITERLLQSLSFKFDYPLSSCMRAHATPSKPFPIEVGSPI